MKKKPSFLRIWRRSALVVVLAGYSLYAIVLIAVNVYFVFTDDNPDQSVVGALVTIPRSLLVGLALCTMYLLTLGLIPALVFTLLVACVWYQWDRRTPRTTPWD
ncbi:hypothetical protein [Rhodococcus sp. NBC_00297]|uniref:hypothetical protein n=1 Tax=Rhodococcus sp. NBC_00297 TaxID=2976005 RepID=UPI002E280225|nr:hypothetical protein [Rhodococcus sp. NBC_00297]